jgi:hypothetical protein
MAASTSTRRTLPPLEVTTTGIPDAEHVAAPLRVVDDTAPPTVVWTLPSRGIRDVPWEAGLLLLALFVITALFAQRADSTSQQWVPTSSLFTQSAHA